MTTQFTNNLAQAFGLMNNTALNGPGLQNWREGLYNETAAYNRLSVSHAREFYLRMNFIE
ncbi:MAG: hypothetical protein ABSB19_06810 [Methylomonas sp.]|jgi:hypothetical protein